MKKIAAAILMVFFGGLSSAQTFTFVPSAASLSDTLNSDMAFFIPIHNTSPTPIVVSVIRRQNAIPNEWISSMCFDQSCFAPFIDSVATTADFGSAPIPPGGEVDFSMHVTPMMVHGTGTIRLTAKNNGNPSDSITLTLTAKSKTVGVEYETAPARFALSQNYPNPFNPSTSLRYEIAEAGDAVLTVRDMLGNTVAILANGFHQAGAYTVQFDARTMSSGVYYSTLSAGGHTLTKKMTLVK